MLVFSPGIAPSGLMFYTGDRFPSWKGNLFIGSARWGQINQTGSLCGSNKGRETAIAHGDTSNAVRGNSRRSRRGFHRLYFRRRGFGGCDRLSHVLFFHFLSRGGRFGVDAARWVNSRDDIRLRGINAIVVEPGTVSPGDEIRKL